MPVSLGRRIRRIGIPPKAQRTENWKADLQDPHVAAEAAQIISVAKHRRKKARTLLQERTRKQIKGSRPRSRKRTKKIEVTSRGKK